ncbi:MAG: TolC family protein, partial [Spirochaetes bacterium]|nr:TolC family protein [Spirochaetota bacterium]
MRKGKKGIIFVFMFLFALNAGWAETMRLTLEEAIGLGLQNSSTLKSKKLAVFSAQAGVLSAKSSYYPGVSVSTSYTHIFKELKYEPDSYYASSDPISISADVSQTIYTFGKIKNAVRISEENVKAAEMDFEEEMRNLIVEIKRGFYGFILAGEVLRVQEETLSHKDEALEVARKRYDAGLSPDYEVLSAESDVENFKPDIISARNQVEFALLAVKNLMGIEEEGTDFDIELIGTLEPEYYSFQK